MNGQMFLAVLREVINELLQPCDNSNGGRSSSWCRVPMETTSRVKKSRLALHSAGDQVFRIRRNATIIIIITHTLMAKANQGGGEGDYSQPWQKKEEERKTSANQNNNKRRDWAANQGVLLGLREMVREITNKGRHVFT